MIANVICSINHAATYISILVHFNMERKDDRLQLTSEELTAEKRDEAIKDLVRQINDGNDAPGDLTDHAISVAELEYWASLGNIAKVKLALQHGEDINARGDNGYTALHAAAANGHLDTVKLLVAQGANISAKLDSGESVIELAKLAGDNSVVGFLNSLNENCR